MFLILLQNSVSTISIFPRNIVIWELSPEGEESANIRKSLALHVFLFS